MLWRSLLASLLLNLTFFSDGLIDQMELDELDLNSEISLVTLLYLNNNADI